MLLPSYKNKPREWVPINIAVVSPSISEGSMTETPASAKNSPPGASCRESFSKRINPTSPA